jgi:hypothetical protein
VVKVQALLHFGLSAKVKQLVHIRIPTGRKHGKIVFYIELDYPKLGRF